MRKRSSSSPSLKSAPDSQSRCWRICLLSWSPPSFQLPSRTTCEHFLPPPCLWHVYKSSPYAIAPSLRCQALAHQRWQHIQSTGTYCPDLFNLYSTLTPTNDAKFKGLERGVTAVAGTLIVWSPGPCARIARRGFVTCSGSPDTESCGGVLQDEHVRPRCA